MRTAHRGPVVWHWTDSQKGAPVLPVIRHFQVERELCPKTHAGFPDLVGYGLQVVRNTYQSIDTR